MELISAAIIVVAGALTITAGARSDNLTLAARQRLVGIGYFLIIVGLLVWVPWILTDAIVNLISRH